MRMSNSSKHTYSLKATQNSSTCLLELNARSLSNWIDLGPRSTLIQIKMHQMPLTTTDDYIQKLQIYFLKENQ